MCGCFYSIKINNHYFLQDDSGVVVNLDKCPICNEPLDTTSVLIHYDDYTTILCNKCGSVFEVINYLSDTILVKYLYKKYITIISYCEDNIKNMLIHNI